MNLSQEFHEHLQAGRVSAAISLVVGRLVELKIVTKASSGTLQTTVDLLNGQIISTVDPAFISDKATQRLLDFHTNQITATAHLVKEQLRSLQDLLQVLPPPVPVIASSLPALPVVPVIAPLLSQVAEPETPLIDTIIADPISATLPETPTIDLDNHEEIDQPAVAKLPKIATVAQPESKTSITSGLVAALAQTSAPDPAEASTIPNKFDQALKSAGVRSTDEGFHPFIPEPSGKDIVQPDLTNSSELIHERELLDLLSDTDEDWDEWLLGEDNILSELSDVTKDNLPDLEASWLADQTSDISGTRFGGEATRTPADWDEFMPECADLNTMASKNQANVERFRQNLVNDPQLMSELLAELDDLEEFGDNKPKP